MKGGAGQDKRCIIDVPLRTGKCKLLTDNDCSERYTGLGNGDSLVATERAGMVREIQTSVTPGG